MDDHLFRCLMKITIKKTEFKSDKDFQGLKRIFLFGLVKWRRKVIFITVVIAVILIMVKFI